MIKELENQLKIIQDLLQERHHNDVIYLNIEETSEFIKMKVSSIYQLRYQGKIPHYKRGKLLLFKKSELVNWIESSRKETFENLVIRNNLKIK
jgi:excisionase family DNA binding protein